ncbi:MAG: hypothetical protein IPL22_11940 [Bacteroidetes bacterium]|nr:hypothetical protein [Bacteroidota bacterium]
MTKLKKHIELLQPDVLITFGPDGEYGHSEHIVTSAVVQEVLLREGWVEKYPLFFLHSRSPKSIMMMILALWMKSI